MRCLRISATLITALAAFVLMASACSSPTVMTPTPTEPTPQAAPAPAPVPAPAPAPAPVPSTSIVSDAALFTHVTQTQPFSSYALFPNLNAGADGVLTASSAHQPLIRVRLNATAAAALQNGRLPAGTSFPDGSVIFKEVLGNNRTADLYAVMYKDRANALAGGGWLWAELRLDGSAVYSITRKGSDCTGCHSLTDGSRNDLVRIFERQR